jgi:hypothetical protein
VAACLITTEKENNFMHTLQLISLSELCEIRWSLYFAGTLLAVALLGSFLAEIFSRYKSRK